MQVAGEIFRAATKLYYGESYCIGLVMSHRFMVDASSGKCINAN